MKIKSFAALLIDGKEVTKRQTCWLTISVDGKNAKGKISRELSFESPASGLAVVRFFKTRTGKRWLMDMAETEGRLSPGFTAAIQQLRGTS